MLRDVRGFGFYVLVGGSLFGTSPVLAPTPPEANMLREAREEILQVDPQFEEWLNSLYVGPSSLEMTEAEFQDASAKMDTSTRLLLQLRRGSRADTSREIINQAMPQFQKTDASLLREPLAPYLAFALMDSPSLDSKDRQLLKDFVYEKGGQSCPRKKVILQDLKQLDRGSLKAEAANLLLRRIKEFKSLSFQEEALRALLTNLQPQATKELQSVLGASIAPFPRLVSEYPQLLDESPHAPRPVLDLLQRVEKQATQEQCAEAQAKFLEALEQDKDKKFLPVMESAINKVELCFKPKGDKQRLAFLDQIAEALKKSYGFLGEALIIRRQGLIYWGRNEFDQARELFSKLVQESEKDHPEIHAEALFTYARILENEGKFTEAIERYEAFIQKYPGNEQLNQALGSLIILYSLEKKPDQALTYALKIIELEAVKETDLRDSASASMALFWAGKISFDKKDKKRAEFYWSRLAHEHYSTFYGALGHYAVEKLTHKKFMLPPIQTPEFDREALYQAFKGEDRNVILRAELLLRHGLKDEASCEIREIAVVATDTQRQLVKAIFQYAAGDWLGAVRIYQNLPKSFRIKLPRGVERVLFPLAYGDLVRSYAQKVSLDPQYIHAIIRQESVFNPRAQSPVGARGLMQLMPGTARLEIPGIRGDYIAPDKLEKVHKVRSDESMLNDPEVNIALGVQHVHRLFQKYKHPVFVLTSYNANPRATERWMERIDSSDMILFIERIPYRETRSYVKLVMRNYFYYKRWYEGPTSPVPLFEALLPKSLTQHVVTAEAPKAEGETRQQ